MPLGGYIVSSGAFNSTHSLNFTDARGKTLHCHCSVADCHMNLKFAVISVLMLTHAMPCDHLFEFGGVQNVQHRSQNRALWYAEQRSSCRQFACISHLLCSVRQERIDPSPHNVWQSKSMLQPLQQEIVVDGVECWGQVQETKQSDLSCIYIRPNAQQSRFGWVVLPISWLVSRHQVVG